MALISPNNLFELFVGKRRAIMDQKTEWTNSFHLDEINGHTIAVVESTVVLNLADVTPDFQCISSFFLVHTELYNY